MIINIMAIRLLIIKDDHINLKDISFHLKSKNNISDIVSNILHQLGIPSNLKGYQYLKTIIIAILNNNIDDNIYTYLANYYSTSYSCVESAIRHAIDIAWLRGNYELIEMLFESSISYQKTKPTNSEFIYTVVDALKEKNYI